MATSVIIAVLLCWSVASASNSYHFKKWHYQGSTPEPESEHSFLYRASVRSKLECTGLCARDDTCHAVTFCSHTCDLIGVCGAGGCGDSRTPGSGEMANCAHLKKVQVPRQEEVCLNNGTWSGKHCACPLQYAGKRCQRLIRDCSEPFEQGANHTSNGVYLIQPHGSEMPFPVRCAFEFDGTTYALYRKNQPFKKKFTLMKTGFGDDLTQVPDSKNFFLGLEKMHLILKQANYVNSIFMIDKHWQVIGSVNYVNFTLAAESDKYAISYGNVKQTPAEDGFGGGGFPIFFSALGFQGSEMCAQARGSPGWYGPGCYGYSPFADIPQWPVGGTTKDLNLLNMNLIRKSPFYEE